MKLVLWGLFACLGLMLAYVWWREGTVVMRKSINGFTIQVREVPYVPTGGKLSSPPGVANVCLVIEAGGDPPIATYRLDPSSESLSPTAITAVGAETDRVYQVQFSNGTAINFRFANGQIMLAEWFRGRKE